MKRIEMLGNYNLNSLGGWLPMQAFCQYMPFTENKVRSLRNTGKWLDGVITKCLHKEIWINVWEVSLWLERSGLN